MKCQAPIQVPMPDDTEIKLPIRDPMPDDTEIKCNRPSSPTKDAVTQTCITIEHLSYSNENLMNSQKMRKFLFLSKVLKSSLHYTGVSILYQFSLRSRRYSRAQGGKLEIPPAQKLSILSSTHPAHDPPILMCLL